jgi:hypothetical protein
MYVMHSIVAKLLLLMDSVVHGSVRAGGGWGRWGGVVGGRGKKPIWQEPGPGSDSGPVWGSRAGEGLGGLA